MICFKSRSIIFHVNSFGYNSCSELLLVTLAALAIALLSKAVLALAIVAVTVFSLHAPVAVFLAISSTAVSMALAMELAMFTFAIVALAVGSLHNTSCSNSMAGVTISPRNSI